MLSTNSQPNETTTTKRKIKDGSRIVIPCPTALSLYSENMRGVDHNDQLRVSYMVRSKSRKCYKHIFMFLLELAIINSFVLHSTYANVSKPITLRTYRLQLAEQLISTYNSRKLPGRRPSEQQQQTTNHYAMKHKSTSKKGVSRCELCSQNGQRRETTWYCRSCNISLCHTGKEDGSDCFSVYHESQSYVI